MDKYYVYEWFDVESSHIFYVGKGTGRRYKNHWDRNQFFKDYYESHKCDVRIVKYFENEDEAFDYEKELTEYYRNKGMCECNLIDGGFGGYSNVWNDSAKEYMSRYNPMKNEEQRKRMSDNNPMKNPEISNKVNSQKRRRISIDGIIYESIKKASLQYGISPEGIGHWLNKGYDRDGHPCFYIDPPNQKHTSRGDKIYIGETLYNSIAEASRILKISASVIRRRIKNNLTIDGNLYRYANQQPS